MKNNGLVSDEMLNAFIDNELDKPERERVLELLEHDQILSQRLCELTRLKELVRMARPEYEGVLDYDVVRNKYQYVGYAALILLTFAIGFMLFLFRPDTGPPAMNQTLVSIVEQQAGADEIKVVLQVTHSDDALVDNFLTQVESILELGPALAKPVRVEIVASGMGLDLLRSDKSPYASRIHLLRERYDNLLFVACQETLQKIQSKTAEQVPIINGIAMVHSGSGEVQLRRKQGWIVLKI